MIYYALLIAINIVCCDSSNRGSMIYRDRQQIVIHHDHVIHHTYLVTGALHQMINHCGRGYRQMPSEYALQIPGIMIRFGPYQVCRFVFCTRMEMI